jgi:restriction system protein
MAVPKYHEFMKPLPERLADGREHKLRDLYAALANDFRLTDADRAEYLPSGRQHLYHNRIGWAKTYLVKAGLLESPCFIRIPNSR